MRPDKLFHVNLLLVLIAFALACACAASFGQCVNGQCQPRPTAYRYPPVTHPVASFPYSPAPQYPAPQPAYQPPPVRFASRTVYASPSSPVDPLEWVNAARAERGLRPFARDPGLAAAARANNAQQGARGLGHYVTGGGRQCSAWGGGGAAEAVVMWTRSPGHAAILYGPGSVAGMACDGSYATLNVR